MVLLVLLWCIPVRLHRAGGPDLGREDDAVQDVVVVAVDLDGGGVGRAVLLLTVEVDRRSRSKSRGRLGR